MLLKRGVLAGATLLLAAGAALLIGGPAYAGTASPHAQAVRPPATCAQQSFLGGTH